MPYLILIFSVIQPVYALIFSINLIIKRNSGYIGAFCVSLAFALLAYTSLPSPGFDLERHYQHIISLRGYSLETVIYNSSPGYLLFDIYAWFLNLLNLEKEFFPASIVLIAYFLVLSVFVSVKLKFLQNTNAYYIALIFISFWLGIGYIGLVSGIRNPFANIVMLFLTYNLFVLKKNILFVIGSLIAFFIHPFSMALTAFSFFAYSFSYFSIRSRVLVFLGFFFILTTKFVSIVIDYISGLLQNLSFYSGVYFDASSDVGGGAFDVRSNSGIIMHLIIPRIPVVIAQLYLLTIKPERKDPYYLLLAVISLYLGIFISYDSLYTRMASFFIYNFAVYIAIQQVNRGRKVDKYFLIIYTVSLILYSVTTAFLRYPEFIASSFPSAISKPLLLILFL